MKHLILLMIVIVKAGHASADSGDNDTEWKVSYYNGLRLGYEYSEGIPKTYTKAKKKGWVLASPMEEGKPYDCSNGGSFRGVRMIKGTYPEAAVLYDISGGFCGVQMLFPDEDLTQADIERFAKEPAYQKTEIWTDGKYHPYHHMTIYTRDPDTICEAGYEAKENYMTGTIDGIYVQRGLTCRKKHIVKMPDIMDASENDDEDWTRLNCYDGMGYVSGYHLEAWSKTDCDRGFPCLGLYDPSTKYLAGMAAFPLLSAEDIWPNNVMVDHLDTKEVQWVTKGPDCLKDRTIPALFFYAIKTPADILHCPLMHDDEYHAAADETDADADDAE